MFYVFKQIATAARSNNQGIVKKNRGASLCKIQTSTASNKTAAVVQVGWQ